MKIINVTPFEKKVCIILYKFYSSSENSEEIYITGIIKKFYYNKTHQEFEMCFYIGDPLPEKHFTPGEHNLKVNRVLKIKELSQSESLVFKLRYNL
mgnify:CR=1 FL=1